MAKRGDPTPDILRQLLDYDPLTGALTWRVRDVSWFSDDGHPAAHTCAWWNSRFAGKPALQAVNGNGYRAGDLFSKKIPAHRVIWAWVHGKWPEGDIDHINGVRTDNRLSNLRAVSRTENSRNQRRRRNNTSGVLGVSRHRNGWQARICVEGREIHLGYFDLIADAAAARKQAEAEYLFHANHGRVA